MARHLHQSLFLAAKLHCERAGQFLVLLAQLRLLGFERHIFIAVEFDPHSGIAVEDIVAAGNIAGRSRARFGRRAGPRAGFQQPRPKRVLQVNLFEFELTRLELRLNLFDEMEVGPLRLRVVRLARHRDVTARGFLVQRGTQFAPVEQPPFEIGGGLALRRPCFQTVEQRRDSGPLAPVNSLGHEPAGSVGRQRAKRQRNHRDKMGANA